MLKLIPLQEFIEDDGQIFTPFIIAAKNGKYNVVFTLLMKFKPDLEKECVIKFDGHIVSGATALWCAAGSGKIQNSMYFSCFEIIYTYFSLYRRAHECC